MKGKKIIFLFLALMLPGFIFVFLKIFGKNEFAVAPLFQTEAPALPGPCAKVTAPYRVAVNQLHSFLEPVDSLAIIFFSDDSVAGAGMQKTITHLKEHYETDPIHITREWPEAGGFDSSFHCIFAMKKPLDIALVDNKGIIRGQYESTDRDEIDRLKTEITIILKRY